MFSLIIVIISIALVAALALATLYYGGTTSAKAQSRAVAATLVNQAAQINAAGTIAVSQGKAWPTTAGPWFAQPFLSSMPVPPKSAYVPGLDNPAATDWTYYLDPESPSRARHFVLKNKISREVCMAVNKDQGLIGIPAVWDGVSLIQCFGPGVSVGPDNKAAYTFFYDPMGSTPGQKEAALDQSKVEGDSTTPGYPRSCPDGTSITSGLCPTDAGGAASPGSGGPGSGPGPIVIPDGSNPLESKPSDGKNVYRAIASPGILDTSGTTEYGDSWVYYCLNDAPEDTVTPQSKVILGGTSLPVSDASGNCAEVQSGHPANAAGPYPFAIVNPDGSTGYGTIHYVDEIGAAPVLATLSPTAGPYNQRTPITIGGSGFKPGVVVTINGIAQPTTYVSATRVTTVMPTAAELGYLEPVPKNSSMMIANIYVNNPGGASADGLPMYRHNGTDQPGSGGTLTPSTPSLSFHDFIIHPGGSAGGIANNSFGVIHFYNTTKSKVTVSKTTLLGDAARFGLVENTCPREILPGDGCRMIIHYRGQHVYYNPDPIGAELVSEGPWGRVFGAAGHTATIQFTLGTDESGMYDEQVATLKGETLGVGWMGSVKYAGELATHPEALCYRVVRTGDSILCYENNEIDPMHPETPSTLKWVLVRPNSTVFTGWPAQAGIPPAGWNSL